MTLLGLAQRWRRWKLSILGLKVDRSCVLGHSVSFGPQTKLRANSLSIGPECEIGSGTELNPWMGRITIANNVFIGPGCTIYGHGGVDIGAHSLIAMHCSIVSSNHTVPAANQNIRDQPDILLPTRIGRDVWLGAGVIVLGGVTIGDGCVVGAGAVVTHDLPPYSIAVGVPARGIGSRK